MWNVKNQIFLLKYWKILSSKDNFNITKNQMCNNAARLDSGQPSSISLFFISECWEEGTGSLAPACHAVSSHSGLLLRGREAVEEWMRNHVFQRILSWSNLTSALLN